ncbi:MAG: hypothetical protein ACRC8K_11505 [Waterburya sp.]
MNLFIILKLNPTAIANEGDRFFMSTFPMNHEPYMTNVMVRS